MRISPKFKKNWKFYLEHLDLYDLDHLPILPDYDKEGLSAMESFYLFDSTGILYNCKDLELFKKVYNLKKNINLQIQEWVRGYNRCFIGINEYLGVYKDPPEWIEKSFRGQLYKGNEFIKRQRYK